MVFKNVYYIFKLLLNVNLKIKEWKSLYKLNCIDIENQNNLIYYKSTR